MRARGFEKYKWWTFARTSARGVSLILAFDIQSGARLRVYPYLWVPELDADNPAFVFPDDATQYATFPSWIPEWHGTWDIETEAEAKLSLADLIVTLDQVVLPWATAIDDGKALVQLLTECYAFSEPRRSEVYGLLLEKYK